MSFKDQVDVPVRWGDMDSYEHVNNTVFLRFIEEGRIHLFSSLGVDWKTIKSGPVVVNINCNFRRAIHYPATVRVLTEASAASEKRMVMQHRLVDADQPDILYSDAEVTAVWVNLDGGGSVPLPSSIRKLLD